ncbi:DUF1707 domain-containing protein [Klenkia sp. PcliD-1-E]|uniref:DUF1707 SHOCT-like domain-containing protein n=1 Tax=Klenkia sp. PcliD-1-E TaxID=2954492 RepID=UPI002097B658|nr:DUF1707 domain-containing protein [Klenkia sp. PcliD-1-E]MCO7220973.1 DUF1707 domain-containing protein [Klenkia sp. PcliD-1-E]
MTDPVSPSQLRVSDADRALVETRLRRAVEVGQLELRELDERARLVWGARTRGDLDAVTADLGPLPAPAVTAASASPARRDRSPVFSDTGGGTAMRVLTTIWACVLVVNVVTWAAVSLGTGEFIFPWPLFVLTPGAVLLTLYVAGIGRPGD